MDSIIGLIFSKNRAMQIQATIESFFMCCNDDVEKMYVLYKASSPLHQRQYEHLQKKFGNISFQEEYDFKSQTLAIVSQSKYVLFLVDDNLFVQDFSISEIIASLEANKDAIGFSLRLGRNTNYCYPKNVSQSLPAFEMVGDGILKYDWTKAKYDFGYPLELCSSVYRLADILPILETSNYSNPNSLEEKMVCNTSKFVFTRNHLLCFERSVAFTNPINIVQDVTRNRVGSNGEYSSEKLAELFENGFRIEVGKYSGFLPKSCHQEVELKLSLCKNEVSSCIS